MNGTKPINNASNQISIIRKQVYNNIPMFDDEKIEAQNKWVKLYDLRCIDGDPGVTARIYALENDPNYKNQNTTSYYNFSFGSAHQMVKPPYDIKEGDYVAFKQQTGDEISLWKIVKRETVQLFHNCCVYIITCNATTPRELERLMECGVYTNISDEEVEFLGKVDYV